MGQLNKTRNPFMSRLFLLMCLALVVADLPLTLFVNDRYAKTLQSFNIEKATNIIYFFTTTSDLQQNTNEKIISALNNPRMGLNFSLQPKYVNTIDLYKCKIKQQCNVTLEEIRASLREVNFADLSPPITFSYYVASLNQWLNFSFERDHYPMFAVLMAVVQIIIIFIVFTYLFSIQRFTRPWEKIVSIAAIIGLSIKQKRVPFFGPTIIKESISLMEVMVEKIDQLINERITTIAALSHDIRTPLTRMNFYVQKVQDEKLKDSMVKQINEIQYLLEETLSYAKKDYKDEPKRRIDLVSLISSICSDMCDINQQVQFETEVTNFIILGQRTGLKRAISNLIENGIKYGNSVTVFIAQDKKTLSVKIVDRGAGLPKEVLQKILQPFYRYTQGHNKKIPGTGLGLTIAKNIIEDNHGELLLQNSASFGLEVILLFFGEDSNEL